MNEPMIVRCVKCKKFAKKSEETEKVICKKCLEKEKDENVKMD